MLFSRSSLILLLSRRPYLCLFLEWALLWISCRCTCLGFLNAMQCRAELHAPCIGAKVYSLVVGKKIWRSLYALLSSHSLSKRPVRKQNKSVQESVAKRKQAQKDMQQYAVARCVAMVKKMIGQTLDYSVRFPKQPPCTHTAAAAAAAQHTHTYTHSNTWLSWNKLADCSSFTGKAIWMEMRNGSPLPKNSHTPGPAVKERNYLQWEHTMRITFGSRWKCLRLHSSVRVWERDRDPRESSWPSRARGASLLSPLTLYRGDYSKTFLWCDIFEESALIKTKTKRHRRLSATDHRL